MIATVEHLERMEKANDEITAMQDVVEIAEQALPKQINFLNDTAQEFVDMDDEIEDAIAEMRELAELNRARRPADDLEEEEFDRGVPDKDY